MSPAVRCIAQQGRCALRAACVVLTALVALLALPHKVDVWTYDVVDEEVLNTNFGPLPTIHLKPRRVAPRPGELSAEIWFAPQLRYLPVRIRIQQDTANYVDLLISKKPEMGAP